MGGFLTRRITLRRDTSGHFVETTGQVDRTYAGYSYYNQSAQTDRLGIAFANPAKAFAPESWVKQPQAILTKGPQMWDKGAIHEHGP